MYELSRKHSFIMIKYHPRKYMCNKNRFFFLGYWVLSVEDSSNYEIFPQLCLHKICILWNTLQLFVKKIVKCCWNVCGWLRKNRCSWLNEIWMASFNIKDCFLLPCIQSSYIPTIAFLSKKTGNSSAERNLLHWTFILWLGSFNYLEIWLFINASG